MLGRGLVATLAGMAAVAALTSCTVAPDPPDFGYRMEGGVLVVVFPRCPSESVTGAAVLVSRSGQGNFEYLWRAKEPARRDVEEGRFSVGDSTSFGEVGQPLREALPEEFDVKVTYVDAGGREKERDGVVRQGALKGVRLRGGEYMTWPGKVMTRQQIDAQRK
ncbi:hypothetical protein [Streptomyces laurentii]|uniref:hypothetical protein n=1 Tax=Streptomyces laurentii TaxID=39478 RepID=UPI0036A3C499